jgi:hypothetical protein
MDTALLEDFNEPDMEDVIVAADPVPITVKEKWQGAVTASSGFVAVPVSMLRLQTNLKLTPTDMLVLINLLAHWWDPQRSVFPRTTTVAQRMGVTKRTVQRSMRKLVSRGLMERGYTATGRRTLQFLPLAERLAGMIGTSLSRKEVLDT